MALITSDPIVVWSYDHMIIRSYDLIFSPMKYFIREFVVPGSGRLYTAAPSGANRPGLIPGPPGIPAGTSLGSLGPFPNGSLPTYGVVGHARHSSSIAAILAQGLVRRSADRLSFS